MASWVQTTCPPGWLVQWEAQRAVAYRVARAYEETYGSLLSGATDRDGYLIRRSTVAEANRLAWERWALEVLGGRLRWDWWDADEGDDLPGPLLVAGDLCLTQVAWGGSDGFAVWDASAEGFIEQTHCADPVEALARLAALTLAVLGPATTEEKSKC